MRTLKGFVALVDDEESLRRAFKRLLRALDFEVETFASGLEFLASLPQRRPDCVIVDVHMPGMTGLDLLQRLGTSHPGIPAIVIAALDDPELETRALRAGAYCFFHKPVPSDKLVEALRAAIGWDRR